MAEFGTPKTSDEIVEGVSDELKKYSEDYNIRGLEGRLERGLDPAGMLAVAETRTKLLEVAGVLGATEEEVIELTNRLHTGAIWENADKLAKGDSPDIQTWMIAGEATVNGKEKEGDLSQDEFLADLERVNSLLDEAVKDPKKFLEQAKGNLVDRSKEKFTLEDGVPVSEVDDGFLAMAINGHHAGIVADKDGLFFVGSEKLDFDMLENMGLKKVEREDRGRKSTFYVDAEGKDVIKKLYDGFGIVLSGDRDIAKKLAGTGL
jgi:hypothetical protein